jgi:hypothetical protein
MMSDTVEASTATTTPVTAPGPGSEPHTGSQADAVAADPTAPNGAVDDERDEQGRYLSREAAGYRRRLRETETERDALRVQVDELQRDQVERLAGSAGMAIPKDLWTLGTLLEHCRDESGRIDADTVTGLVTDVLKERPTWRTGAFTRNGIGEGASAAGTRTGQHVGLSALLKGRS